MGDQDKMSFGYATYPVDYEYDIYGNKIAMTTYRTVGFTSRSAKGEFNTWLVNITEVCLQCEWATFYHVGSFCGGD